MSAMNFLQALPFQSITSQMFTSNGTYTPHPDMLYCWVFVLGSGGAGGSTGSTDPELAQAAAGGQGGGFAMQIYDRATIGASQSVTIGAGGTIVTASNGNPGGTTSFGALISMTGGDGGPVSAAVGTPNVAMSFPTQNGGVTTGTALFSAIGGAGSFGFAVPGAAAPRYGWGGAGGNGSWTPVAVQTLRSSAPSIGAGIAGLIPSGGGGGALSIDNAGNANGGAGGRGEVFIIEFLRTP